STHSAPPPLSPLSLHDALPISRSRHARPAERPRSNSVGPCYRLDEQRLASAFDRQQRVGTTPSDRSASSYANNSWRWTVSDARADRKSTRLNSSHLGISYAVFC